MKIDLIKHLNELPKPRNNSQQKPAFWNIVHEKVNDMSNAGIIQASVSSFCSPIVLAFQKNKHRFCIDYRILNKFTVKFAFNVPRIAEILQALAGKKLYSQFDLKQGYHQCAMAADSAYLTAFSHNLIEKKNSRASRLASPMRPRTSNL
jgi:hypothetical protein